MDPFFLLRPTGDAVLVYDSPHSGRVYPDDFQTKATRAALRQAEDAYVDDLVGGAVAHGVAVFCATYPRAYIDLNRAEDDIDQTLIADRWPAPLKPTVRTLRGLGLIRRFVVPGIEIYRGPLRAAEIQARIDRVYHPYHAAVAHLLEEVRARSGVAWLVDWHSMKSVGNAMTPDGERRARPDFVVGDLHGASAGAELTRLILSQLRAMDYDVAVNDPYAGGAILQRYGRPAAGVHAVQIEINRALYLDEDRVEKTGGFEVLKRNLDRLTRVLSAAAADRA